MFAANSTRLYMGDKDLALHVRVKEDHHRYTLIIESNPDTLLGLHDFGVSGSLDQLEELTQAIAYAVAEQRRFEQLILQDEALAMREDDAR